MEPALLGLALVGYFALAFVWPVVSTWRRHGVMPVVFHREAAPAQWILGVLLGGLLVGLVVIAVLLALHGREPLGIGPPGTASRLGGWGLLLLGSALTLAAQRQMGASWRVGIDDRPTALVTHGLFRFCRNPIFTGLFALLAGVALLCPVWWIRVALLVSFLAIRVQVLFEERHLATLHGAAYLDYAARTGRFLPGVGRLPPLQTGR